MNLPNNWYQVCNDVIADKQTCKKQWRWQIQVFIFCPVLRISSLISFIRHLYCNQIFLFFSQFVFIQSFFFEFAKLMIINASIFSLIIQLSLFIRRLILAAFTICRCLTVTKLWYICFALNYSQNLRWFLNKKNRKLYLHNRNFDNRGIFWECNLL